MAELLAKTARLEYPQQWGGATHLKKSARTQKTGKQLDLDLDAQ